MDHDNDSKHIPLLIVKHHPKFNEMKQRMDVKAEQFTAKAKRLNEEANALKKVVLADKTAFFEELHSLVISEGHAPEGYDPKTWSTCIHDGVLSVTPPSADDKDGDDEIPEAIKEIARQFAKAGKAVKGFSINLD